MGRDFRLAPDNQQPREPEAAQAMQFALEPLPVFPHAAGNQVGHAFALDGEQFLPAGKGVVPGHKRPLDARQGSEHQGRLLARVHDDRGAGFCWVGCFGDSHHYRDHFRHVFPPPPAVVGY